MKRFYETRKEAKKAVETYVRKTVMEPEKKDLQVFKFGKGKKAYFVGTPDDLFYKKVHGV